MASSIADGSYKAIEGQMRPPYTYKLKCVLCRNLVAYIGTSNAYLVGPLICPACAQKRLENTDENNPKALASNADKTNIEGGNTP